MPAQVAAAVMRRSACSPAKPPEEPRTRDLLAAKRDAPPVKDGPVATNPTPAVISPIPSQCARRDIFVQKQLCQQRHENVAERRRRQDVGEIGPGQRGEIATEEQNQQADSAYDPGIPEGQ